MWVDGIAAIAVAVLAALGFRRGALATFLGIFTLLASYALAFFAGPRLGASLAERGVPDLLAVALAGCAVFCVSYLVLATAAHFMRRRDENKRHGRSLSDRLGGAGLGLAEGALVGLMLGVLASWLDAGRTLGDMPWIPDTSHAHVAQISRTVIEDTAGAVLDEGDAGARVALHLATRPTQTLQAALHLTEREEITALQKDTQFWSYVENDQIDRALNTQSFLAISYRKEIRQQLVDLGLADRRGVDDTAFFRQEMRVMLTQLAPRVRALRNDPELAKLANDPDIAKALQEKNTAALLAHPGLHQLVQRVLHEPAQP